MGGRELTKKKFSNTESISKTLQCGNHRSQQKIKQSEVGARLLLDQTVLPMEGKKRVIISSKIYRYLR